MKILRRLLAVSVLIGSGLAASLVVVPSPVDPESYVPGAPLPLTGALAPNDLLCRAEKLSTGEHVGPEDLLVEDGGRITAGMQDGSVVELAPGPPRVIARTGGRPLGLARDGEGRLLIADAGKGLLRLEADGTLITLATGAAGREFRFVNELAVASSGDVYFSDSSDRWTVRDYCFDIIEGRPRGRIMRRDPAGRVTVLADRRYFPNGVALTADESALLFAESTRYRICKLHLTGPRKGQHEVLIDNLPGFPDNLSRTPRGTFWVALFSMRDPLLDLVGPLAWARALVARLPRPLWENPRPYGCALEIDETGRILRSIHDPTGRCLREVTTVVEHGGMLHVGTLRQPHHARLPAS